MVFQVFVGKKYCVDNIRVETLPRINHADLIRSNTIYSSSYDEAMLLPLLSPSLSPSRTGRSQEELR